jgi:hypothetical protein
MSKTRSASGIPHPLPGSAPSTQDIARAAAVLSDPNTVWHDGEEVLHELLTKGLAPARESRGLTQAQLGKAAGMPQSQVSRLERDLESTTVRTVRRLANAIVSEVSKATKQSPKRSRA